MKTFRPNATAANGNGLKKFQGPQEEVSEFQLDYKKLVVGESVRCRILSLAEDDTEYISCKRGNINVKGRAEPISLVVHNLGEQLADIVDHDGTPFVEWKGTSLNRILIWVYGTYKKDGTFEESGELKFVEMGPGLKKSLGELEQAQKGLFAFNEDTCCPEYDLLLSIVPGDGNIPKNYIWEGINMNPKTKKTDDNFNKLSEEVLSAEDQKLIAGQWGTVREAMEARQTEEYIRFKFAQRDGNKSDAPQATPVSSRAGLKPTPTNEDVETETGEGKPKIDYDDPTPEPSKAGTKGGRKYTF